MWPEGGKAWIHDLGWKSGQWAGLLEACRRILFPPLSSGQDFSHLGVMQVEDATPGKWVGEGTRWGNGGQTSVIEEKAVF